MAGNISTSPSKKAYYERYKKENLHDKHKITKIKKYLTKQPNNLKLSGRLNELEAKVK